MKNKIISIRSKTIGKVDGMTIKGPSEYSYNMYGPATDCYFNVGDNVMFLDKKKYNEKALRTMTGTDIWTECFIKKNYRIGTVKELRDRYILIGSEKGCYRINNNQGYNHKLLIEFNDNGEKCIISTVYWLLIGKIF